jgi:hypothetical protein
MTAHYSVAQYVPDPVSDERVNIAVVTWDERRIFARALKDWRRASAIGPHGLATIKAITNRLVEISAAQLSLTEASAARFDVSALKTMIGTWHHAIQFTPPRGSLKDAEALLAEVGPTFLRDLPARVRRRARSRTTAARIAADLMFRAVQERLPNRANELIGKNGELSGHLESHRVDVILGNGRPFAAVQALSFERADSPSLQREVDATAWLVEDVKRKHRTLPVAVFLLPPKGETKTYLRAKKLFPRLNSDLVPEAEMEQWARKQARAAVGRVGAR